jgi:hypothetical protein
MTASPRPACPLPERPGRCFPREAWPTISTRRDTHNMRAETIANALHAKSIPTLYHATMRLCLRASHTDFHRHRTTAQDYERETPLFSKRSIL